MPSKFPHSSSTRWTKKEDDDIIELRSLYWNWVPIADYLRWPRASQVEQRWNDLAMSRTTLKRHPETNVARQDFKIGSSNAGRKIIPFTPKEDDKLWSLYESGMPLPAVAQEIAGRSYSNCRYRLEKLRGDKNVAGRHVGWTQAEDEQLVKMYRDGLTFQEMSEEQGTRSARSFETRWQKELKERYPQIPRRR